VSFIAKNENHRESEKIEMENLNVLYILFIIFGIYCFKNLKKDYAEYKTSKHYLEFNIYIRNLGVVIASVFVLIYQIYILFL
jgi:hypothetical protein